VIVASSEIGGGCIDIPTRCTNTHITAAEFERVEELVPQLVDLVSDQLIDQIEKRHTAKGHWLIWLIWSI
jgi:hypothetical protein